MRVKEFLSTREVEYESINVTATAEAQTELAELGFHSVPVVATQAGAVYGIDLREVAQLVAVAPDEGPALGASELIDRVCQLLAHSQMILRNVDLSFLSYTPPDRNRSVLGLVNHIVEIASCLCDVVDGKTFDESMANAEPLNELDSETLDKRATEVTRTVHALQTNWQRRVTTYYGTRSMHEILERSAWHIAQHLRQLEYFSSLCDVELPRRLTVADLEGLPLPRNVWDSALEEFDNT